MRMKHKADAVLPSHLRRRTFLKTSGAMAVLAVGGVAPKVHADSGSIVVYSTTMTPVQRKMEAAFTAKTGIRVQSIRLINNPLAQRFLSEQNAGQYLCDVITLGLEAFFQDAAQKQLIVDLSAIANISGISSTWRPDKHYVNIAMAPQTIGYNTRKVTGNLIPKSWADVLRPEFAGQVIMPDPRANDTGVAFLDMLHEQYGDDFIRRLGKGLKLAPTLQPAVEQVLAGGASIILPCLAMALIQYEGTSAPISTVPSLSPTTAQNFYSGIATHAPNPQGAAAWMNFTLSREGQEILNKGISVSPLGKIPGSLDAPAVVKQSDTTKSMKKADLLFDLLGLPA